MSNSNNSEDISSLNDLWQDCILPYRNNFIKKLKVYFDKNQNSNNFSRSEALSKFEEFIISSPTKLKLFNKSSLQREINNPLIPDLLFYLLSAINKESLDLFLKENSEGSFASFETLLCFVDRIRTKQFFKAIKNALIQLRALRGSEAITVIDAGCGSIPILGLYASLLDENIKCLCIEENEDSYLIAKELLRAFPLNDSIQIIKADAIKYQHDEPVDLLISETMQTALIREPMAQIMANLVPQLRDKSSMVIPQRVNIKLALHENNNRKVEDFAFINSVPYPKVDLKWDKDSIFTYDIRNNSDLTHIELNLKVSEEHFNKTLYLGISNEVELNADISLKDYESNITIPSLIQKSPNTAAYAFKFESNDKTKSATVTVEYKPGCAGIYKENVKCELL